MGTCHTLCCYHRQRSVCTVMDGVICRFALLPIPPTLYFHALVSRSCLICNIDRRFSLFLEGQGVHRWRGVLSKCMQYDGVQWDSYSQFNTVCSRAVEYRRIRTFKSSNIAYKSFCPGEKLQLQSYSETQKQYSNCCCTSGLYRKTYNMQRRKWGS